ncbi:MAG: alpha-2-macroglobulin family protein, partial [Bacteroidia bacterium]|nr:alpha-2-macroglobulin family protein [Bacteroidia bacterium]
EDYKPSFGGNFSSPLRDKALILHTLLTTDEKNSQIGTFAKQISELLQQDGYYSTQEHVWALLALGKLAQKTNQSSASATISVNGKTIANVNETTVTLTKEILNQNVTISVSGKGSIYYFWEVSGLSADGSYVEEDKYLKVRRTFLTPDGKTISNKTFRQNELIIVKLSVKTLNNEVVENVVLSDYLPAGLEIENPRISELPGQYPVMRNRSQAIFTDLRDDRVNFYITAGSGEQHYYYLVRAVTPGRYRMGPASADAMYAGEYHSYHGGGWIQVLEK